jgi:hypothetical protein
MLKVQHVSHSPSKPSPQTTLAGVGIGVGACVSAGVGAGVGTGVGTGVGAAVSITHVLLQPWAAAVITVRLRDCEPAVQDLEYVDHAPNDDTTQCTAHACALQPRVSSRYGQA